MATVPRPVEIQSPLVSAAQRCAAAPPPDALPIEWPGSAAVHTALAALIGLLAIPAVLAVAVLVKLTSRGPVIYSQTRLGRGGRPFRIYKFRTMWHDCERQSGPQWSRPGDPRVTPLGRLLRATHLDELPQLWNVLKGDMSLVGPRPERPEIIPVLEQAIPEYRERLRVRPGVTGLAQVRLPPDTDLASVRRKLVYDLYYVAHGGLLMDFRLIACTALGVLGVPHPALAFLLRIPGGKVVEGHAAIAAPHPATIARMESAR
jgi:lipopolysaccharide/colanic/teichoic acid biosynthesis glycosyltransferase